MKLNIRSRWGAPGSVRSKWSVPVALLASAVVVTGCGGGGRSGAAPTPTSTAPTVSAIAAQTINQDTPTSALAFTVSDDALDSVKVVVSSSDSTLLPSYGLVLGGSGGSRTITVTPAEDAIGTANVSVTASDAQGNLTSSIFPVTVKAVSQSIASYTSSTFALMEGDTPVPVSGFTFVQDADDDATFATQLQ